jgi:hypothetical protein
MICYLTYCTRHFYFVGIVCLMLAIPILSHSQSKGTHLWLNYAISVKTDSNFSYGGDVGLRGLITDRNWTQFLIRPAATYKINRTFNVAGAVAVFQTFNRDGYNLAEFRTHQDFNARWPRLSVLSIYYRVRIEQRWFFYQNFPNDFDVRGRLLVGVQSKDFTWLGEKIPIYFHVIWEGFNTLTKDSAVEFYVNQSRLHFAFGQRISENFRYELHYIWQRSRQFSEDGLQTSQNVFRIRAFHTIFKN